MFKIKELWKKACKHDGINPAAKFVVFSLSNPFIQKYNEAMGQLLEGRNNANKQKSD